MFNKIEEALQDIKKGKMVIIVDGKNRENEGDLVLAAEFVTPQAINFMITHGKGLVCIAMTQEDLDKLNITQMVENNTDNHQTAFTISVDYKDTKTGISAFERALTIQQLINPESKAEDFKRPGHVFPLKAREKGILDRPGHTEATVDLTELAGLKKAGVICEIINEDGKMARLPELKKIAKKWNLKIISITDLIDFKKKIKLQIRKVSKVYLPTKFGNFLM
ncbi:MAG: 3,4-dihydroxy-2-butanone-4-phosphate synthase, partial [Candidatus Cloacimonetes bacterium]|nr:3,4-dihydroxy-2-butanone-4-phosphate synthase [Candidatus Cloacimonadota bacterium]